MGSSTVSTDVSAHPFVTVIVPVYDHVERLNVCLGALQRQTYPASHYEVIVVDNSAAGVIRGVVAENGGPGDGVAAIEVPLRWLHEPVPGSYAARNTGASAAQGEVLAFTDADCIPEAGWIERGVQAVLQHPTAGLVAGRVDLFYRDPEAPNAVELFEGLVAFEQKEYAESGHFGSTANVFVRVDAFRAVGGFNAHLKSLGDVDLGRRITTGGYDVVYGDDAVVLHPARRSLPELVRRTRRLAGGANGLQNIRHSSAAARAVAFLRSVGRDVVPPVRFAARVFHSEQVGGVSKKVQVIFLLMLVRWVAIFEKLRLRMGGETLR